MPKLTLYGDKVGTDTTIFGDPVELLYDPVAEEKKIKDTLDVSEELGLSIVDVDENYEQLIEKPKKLIPGTIIPPGIGEPTEIKAAPERTKWQKFKKFFVGERPPLPPNADRIEKLTRAFDIGITLPMRVFLKLGKGMTLNAPDLMWAAIKRITPDDMWTDEVRNMNLDEAMDWAGGYNPSGFQKSVGEIAEFVGRLRTVAPIAQKLGIIGKTPKHITVLDKAFETAKLFGTAAVVEQVTKGASEIIEPTEAEYGFEGPKAVLRDMVIGAVFSFLHSGVKGAWSKLTPSETTRALKLLGLKKGASPAEITKAANNLARQYHPDKVKGFRTEFEQVIKARDVLRQGEFKDIVFRGQKVILKPKLLLGEIAKVEPAIIKKPVEVVKAPPTEAIAAPKKAVAPITPEKAVVVEGMAVFHGTGIDYAKKLKAGEAIKFNKAGGFSVSKTSKAASEFGDEVVKFIISPNAKIATPENLPEAISEGTFNLKAQNKAIALAKAKGFDVIDIEAFVEKTGEKDIEKELQIINPDVLILAKPEAVEVAPEGKRPLSELVTDIKEAWNEFVETRPLIGREHKQRRELAEKRIKEARAKLSAELPPKGIEPWQMTKRQFEAQAISDRSVFANIEAMRGTLAEDIGLEHIPTVPEIEATTHRREIEKALKEGKPVSAEVLAEYPDLAKPEAVIEKPKKEAGFAEVEKVIKAAKAPARWFLSIFEPAKLTASKHGKEVVSTVMRGIHKPEAKVLEFEAKELENLDKTYKQMEDWLDSYPRDVQEQIMLSRGHGLEGVARGLQKRAFASLPKELKDSKVRRALDEIAEFNYEYLKEVEDNIGKMEDYFYGIYKNPKKITAFLDFWKTTKRFTKEKVFPTYADARAYGLEIRNPNPVVNLKSEYKAIAHLASMKWLKEELIRVGEGLYIMNAGDAPFDWDIIGDKRRVEPTFADVRVEPELARLINNLISTNKITQVPVLDFFRKVNNFLRTIKFIGSGFHLIQIGKQSVADSGYLGFYKITATRGLTTGFEKIDPIFKTPEYKWYIENGGGHKYAVESEARKAFEDVISKLTKSEQAIVKGVFVPLKLPVGFVNWMFNSYIPKVKYGKFLDTVAEKERKTGKQIMLENAVTTQEIIKEQQNFYGMMNERLFGRSGTVTTALRFIFMAPGYAEGNYRTMIKAGSQWGFGDEGYRAERSRVNIVNSWLITTTLATVGTLILTGKLPEKPKSIEELRDLLKIDTGKKDERGHKIMIDLATYDKDYWNVFFNTLRGRPDIAIEKSVKRIGGMKAPTLQFLTDLALMFQGKAIYDWKEDRIYHITDPFLEKVAKLTVHEVKRMVPISASVYQTSRRRDVDRTMAALEALVGVRPGRTEKDIKEFEIVRDIWDMRDKREKLSYTLNNYDDPWAAVERYNKTLDDLVDNKFITDELKTKAESLKIDPEKVISWKRFPAEKLTIEQLRISIREHTYRKQYKREGRIYPPGHPHKGWEDRVKELREELQRRQ